MSKASRTAMKIAQVACGFLIAAGALYAWHSYGLSDFLAAIVGLAGLGLVFHAFDVNFWEV